MQEFRSLQFFEDFGIFLEKISKNAVIRLDILFYFHYNSIVIVDAAMAQLVERVLGKDEVGGSNPPSSSKRTSLTSFFCYCEPPTEVGMRTLALFRRYAPYKSAS